MPLPAPGPVLSPTRYLLTDHLGVMFDEARTGSELPRAAPAVLDFSASSV